VRLSLGEGENSGKNTWIAKVIGLLIVFSILLAILATEPVIRGPHLDLLAKLDLVVAILFLVEYLLRLWIASLRDGARRGARGALDFAITPMAILDFVAIAPTVWLVQIRRIGRSKRFRKSVRHFNYAIASKREELQISAIYSAVVISISSVSMYLVEGAAQAEQFGSIPRCLWWSVITVTTVGYVDVSPQIAAGKIVAAMTALLGIAVIAIPICIISSGFTDSLRSEKEKLDSKNA
jgi:voltage-gated potassium channel